MGPIYSKALAQVLQSKTVWSFHHLENLNLWNNRLVNFEIVESIFDDLERLDLSNNPQVSEESYNRLSFKILWDSGYKISELFLDMNKISDFTLKILAVGLKHQDKLRILSLRRNNISCLGVEVLCKHVLNHRGFSLDVLFLGWNSIKSSGATILCNTINKLSLKMHTLELCFNPIGNKHNSKKPECATALSDLFKNSKNLLHMDLSVCGFTTADC